VAFRVLSSSGRRHTTRGTRAQQFGALLLFNVIVLGLTEIPMVSFLVPPDATRHRVDQLCAWTNAHYRLVVAGVAGVVGVYLVVLRISKL
jgi:hypothetical protein